MKTRTIVALAAAAASIALQASVPARWTVETSKPQTVVLDALHGETLDLEATLKSYGRPLSVYGQTARLYWQTNGMESAWWSTNATVVTGSTGATNAICAVFSPSMDPGADAVRGFIGIPGENYRASFVIRFRDSPGATPNVIAQPPRILDLANTVVVNPPWPTDETISSRIRQVIEEDDITANVPTNALMSAVSNIVTRTFVENLGISGGSSGLSSNDVESIVRDMGSEFGKVQSVNGKIGTVEITATDVGALTQASGDERYLRATPNGYPGRDYYVDSSIAVSGTLELLSDVLMSGDVDLTYPNTHIRIYGKDVVYGISTNGTDYLHANVDLSPIASDARIAKSTVNQVSSQVSAIGSHLNAEDAHFVVTNYDSAVRIPEATVEIKLPDNSWMTVWKEMTRWNRFVGTNFVWETWGDFHSWKTNVESELSFKAERNWGMYDSETGGLSPDGYTQISSSNILIAAGMAYQRTVTSGGSVWVLQCNSGTACLGGTTNGFFRVLDGDGNVQFEIVKGNKQELGANATGITVDNSTTPPTVTIPYSVEAGTHPKISCGDDLSTWKDEDEADCLANVTWSGSSGAWVATVRRKTSGSKLFVKATYMSGGATFIRNNAPVSMDQIIINGTNYYLGTATINGVLVPSLRTTR